MFCPKCGKAVPEGAQFCMACGAPIPTGNGPSSGTAPTTTAAPLAPTGASEFKCPSCGAPVHPVFGEMVITCEYCGASVSLGGSGWTAIQKHSMLALKLADANAALEAVRRSMDVGLLHRKAFEESTVTQQKLSFVPYWVLPVSAVTNYQYQDIAASVGSTVGTIAAADMLGGMLGGGRGGGGFMMMPIMMGPTVGSTRQSTISKAYEYPVVAVKALTAYQPHDYQFALEERGLFDRKGIPDGTPILNGDLGEDAARHSAQAFVTQLQSEEAHRQHHMVSNLTAKVEVSEGELLHVPIWHFLLERKGQKSIVLVDAHSGAVIRTVS